MHALDLMPAPGLPIEAPVKLPYVDHSRPVELLSEC